MTQQNQPNDQPEQPDSQDKLLDELKEYKDKYFRALAEIENTRKRLQKEKLESQSFAVQNAILEFLQPLDHFENALKASNQASSEVQNWVKGFEMILAQLKAVLDSHDVSSFETVGKAFDPNFHEAIETEEREDVAEGTILQEFLRGYKMGNRVIRPSRVKVAIAPTASQQNKVDDL